MNIEELEAYFAAKEFKELPNELNLSHGIAIVNLHKFVERQLTEINAHGVNTPGYRRLMKLQEKMKISIFKL